MMMPPVNLLLGGYFKAVGTLKPRALGLVPCIHCGVFVRESDAVCMSCHREAPGADPVHIFGKAIT